VVLVEGEVEERHGVPVVVASRLGRLLPGATFGASHTAPAPQPRQKGVARPA
jgi:hypothetical protein